MPTGDQNYGTGFYSGRTIYGDSVASVTFDNPPPGTKPLFSPVASARDAERERCLAILRKLQAEYDGDTPGNAWARGALRRAVTQIESGE